MDFQELATGADETLCRPLVTAVAGIPANDKHAVAKLCAGYGLCVGKRVVQSRGGEWPGLWREYMQLGRGGEAPRRAYGARGIEILKEMSTAASSEKWEAMCDVPVGMVAVVLWDMLG